MSKYIQRVQLGHIRRMALVTGGGRSLEQAQSPHGVLHQQILHPDRAGLETLIDAYRAGEFDIPEEPGQEATE